MAAIWVVSEESALASTLAHHVDALGEVWLGSPEAASFKSAPPPDLLILCGVSDSSDRNDALERVLAFVRQIPQRRRAAAPVLHVATDAESERDARLERLFDDRRLARLVFPFDPDDLQARARDLLRANDGPESLRERARKLWVTREVERLYAGLDLPALRQAVDPRNAHRPILLIGEPGTRRGLLARYVHNLAEPARDAFVPFALRSQASGELENAVMTRTASRRVTAYLEEVDRAEATLQDELAHLLGASGALALEPLRWIAAASSSRGLSRSLRDLAWLRVELPPLRARADKSSQIDAAFRSCAERQGRELLLEPEARELLTEYAWPGNLRELDRVAEATCAAAAGPRIGPEDLQIASGGASRSAPPTQLPVEPEASSDEDLMLQTLAEDGLGEAELEQADLLELEELEPEPELNALEADLTPAPLPAARPEESPAASSGLSPRQLVIPLAQSIRAPLRAFRTYANLVEQRPDDEHVRRELRALVEHDLGGLEETLQRVERFARLGPPEPRPFDLAAALGAELDARQSAARLKSLVVLRELDAQAPPLVADESQVRLAIRSLLDLALRLVPQGGDLYLGSAWRPKGEGSAAGHRILLRFHSPEEVLTGPSGEPDGEFLEVVIARDLFERAGGSFAIDASGAQDNVILVQLPG